ncbi:MAG: dimethylsulfonioproprionate lyase family protein [Pseudomonadota bacterium]
MTATDVAGDVEVPAKPVKPLADVPDWVYLMREIRELYRLSGAGGSRKIRSHQRVVREAISKLLQGGASVTEVEREDKPVTVHLRRAMDNGRDGPTRPIIRALDAVVDQVSWLYGYEKVPRGLAKKYAFAEIAGQRGPVISTELTMGLVLFGPKCTYPAHAHDGLTESYYVLSGTVSENDDGVWAPGSLIFNPPGRMHRITVSDREPALLVYAWHGPKDKLSHQKMVFARGRAKKT